MPLTSLSLSSKVTFALQATNTGANIGQSASASPATTFAFNLNSLSVATWTQIYSANLVIFVTAPTGLAAVLASGGSLTASTTYYYKITGTGGTQETGGSSEVNATPSGGNLSIKLTWSKLQGATGYKIYRGTVSGSENLLVQTITSGSTLTWTDTGVAGSAGSVPGSPNNYVEFALDNFTNLVGETVTPGHALGLIVAPSGINAQCKVAPGSTNPLTWFFGTSSDSVTIPVTASSGNGGGFVLTGPYDYAGQVIDSTHKTIRITNQGSGNLSCSVGVIVGP